MVGVLIAIQQIDKFPSIQALALVYWVRIGQPLG
jgi:hypothetical protein